MLHIVTAGKGIGDSSIISTATETSNFKKVIKEITQSLSNKIYLKTQIKILKIETIHLQ
jgi:hypothetical protein